MKQDLTVKIDNHSIADVLIRRDCLLQLLVKTDQFSIHCNFCFTIAIIMYHITICGIIFACHLENVWANNIVCYSDYLFRLYLFCSPLLDGQLRCLPRDGGYYEQYFQDMQYFQIIEQRLIEISRRKKNAGE